MPPSGARQPLTSMQASELDRGFRLLQAGRPADALGIAKGLVADAACAPDAYQLLAMCHAETGNHDASAQAFEHALALAPDHPLVLVNYAGMQRKGGKLDASLALLQRAVAVAPGYAKAWSGLGAAALDAGHHGQALAALRRAVELQPDSVLDWHLLGNASRATGDLESAEAAFRKVIALVPGHRSASINLGNVLRLLGRCEDAIAWLEPLGGGDESTPEQMDSLAGAMLEVGRVDEALQLATRLVDKFPEFVPGFVTLANLLWEYGTSPEPDSAASDVFRAAIRQQPGNRELRMAFVKWLLSARAPDEALGQIRTLREDADLPGLVLMQADALEALGKTEEAGILYARLHASWGRGNPAFLNAHVRHLLRAGSWDAAALMAAETTRIIPQDQTAWAYLATAWRLLEDPRETWLCDYDRLIAPLEIEPPAGFVDMPEFLGALQSCLERLHRARRQPIQQSLRGGSQTPGRLFGRPDRVLAAAQSALHASVDAWLATLPADDTHPFLKRKSKRVRFAGSWSVQLWSSGRHANHVHPEGWLSSAFYVSLPPAVLSSSTGASAGHIQFGQPPEELALALAPRRVIGPKPGTLVLFPSYMWHGTVPFEDSRSRLAVAFDMVPQEDAG